MQPIKIWHAERRLRENMNAQNPTTPMRAASQGQNQQLTARPDISPYGDSDSFEESFSDEEGEESVDAPTHHRARAHTRSGKKATGPSHKRRAKEVAQRSKETHTVEGETASCEPAYSNVVHPKRGLHKNVERSTTDPRNGSTKPVVVYQNWPVRRDVVEGISNPNNGSVGLTQHGNTDFDVDEQLQESIETLTRSIKDLEKQVV